MILAINATLLVGLLAAAQAPTVFVGSTPCGDVVRSVVGGLPAGERCHAITWRLTLEPRRGDFSAAKVVALYGVPPPTNPNQMIQGPKVLLDGTWEVVSDARSGTSVYRIRLGKPGQALSFMRFGDDLLHLLDASGRLAVGTAGWSYTLNRADRAEQPGEPSNAPDMSYTISPRASGGTVFGIFEGRTPCTGVTRVLGIQPTSGCMKVKWRVTLFQDPRSSAPTTYKIESSLHRQQAREGTWRILRSSGTPQGVLYELSPTSTEKSLLLLKGDENVLFFHDGTGMLVGNADFSYTLNRIAVNK